MIRGALKTLLRETFDGVPAGGAAWYTDAGPGGSLSDLLNSISHHQASTAPIPGRKTIAAHVEHLRFHMDVLTSFIAGERQSVDWKQSWKLTTVDETAWDDLKRELYMAQARLERMIERTHWKQLSLAAGIGAITHIAHHFGAIRQLALLTRDK